VRSTFPPASCLKQLEDVLHEMWCRTYMSLFQER
jgi:hypothetical protein